ncbi:hypothetical protein NW762_014812 [Fusarium torreyae]|uniref:Uncharacterized protein n=1 Tax=Fusarium torreyae TaxID=1237075 RepID=A0A9W8RKQ9_9HYPO|nr:hypothetical protein NW762_014812 [Fusarium torreyae]
MSGAMINSGGMSNRPLGSVVQKRKQLHGGQRQTRPQQQSQQQRQQPQQPRQPQQQRWKPQQLTQTATRQRHQPSLSTSNDMHPLMTGADLSVSGLHEAQQPEPGAEIDEVDFDSFVQHNAPGATIPEKHWRTAIGEVRHYAVHARQVSSRNPPDGWLIRRRSNPCIGQLLESLIRLLECASTLRK